MVQSNLVENPITKLEKEIEKYEKVVDNMPACSFRDTFVDKVYLLKKQLKAAKKKAEKKVQNEI